MGLFENSHFPYTNFHELNLDKIVDVTKDAKDTADRAETKADQAAATVGTFDQRITANTEAVTNLQTTVGNHEERISYNERMIAINGDLITANTTRYTVLNEKVNNLDSELDTKIQEANTRMDGIDVDVSQKSSVVAFPGTLDAGVLVGRILVNGEETKMYAPTAGSTVVRAVDVPFDKTGLTPPMTGATVQAAISELNSKIYDQDYPDIYADGDEYTNYNDSNLNPDTYGPGTIEEQLNFIANRIYNMHRVMEKNMCYDNDEDSINLNGSYYSGCFTGGQTTLYIMIPYNKIVKRYDGFVNSAYHPVTNPIDNPNNYQWTLSGKITVRGTNGYILNGIDLASASISAISVVAVESGIQIKITVPQVSGGPNNTPVNAWFSDNPTLSFSKT